MHYTVTIQPDGGPTLVAEMDIGGGGALVRSVAVEATNGAGITTMPLVDFAALARALSTTGVEPAGVADAHEAAPVKAARKVAPAGDKPAPTRRTRAAAVEAGKRAYRKAPPDDELLAVHRQADGSVPTIADAFKVPPNTVYSWLKSARARGVLPKATGAKRAASAES